MEYKHVRFSRLQEVVRKAVEHTINRLLLLEQLAQCYPEIAQCEEGPNALENARKQIVKYFHGTCIKQVEHIFSERDMQQNMDQLDEIIQLAERSRDDGSRAPIAVDLLLPEQLIQAELGTVKPDVERKLGLIYEQLKVDNGKLYRQLEEAMEENVRLESEILELVEEISGEVDAEQVVELDRKLELLSEVFFEARP